MLYNNNNTIKIIIIIEKVGDLYGNIFSLRTDGVTSSKYHGMDEKNNFSSRLVHIKSYNANANLVY